jgi:hypothetical protein
LSSLAQKVGRTIFFAVCAAPPIQFRQRKPGIL